VSSYEIVSALGAGGMGEVYRARDMRLDRNVAIKVIPDLFSADADRLARFDREAKTLAALNHPNIAQIYGVVEVGDANATRLVPALVMEFVDGETLADRIARGPIPIDDATVIARQIADALEAAHDAGIVHRDLKPANVKVRPDGTVKVLDFGLAKALSGDSHLHGFSGANVANSPTFAAPNVTGVGMILGTAAYMSPEQARGKAADARSDIWAFGVVVFEMLTGKQLFEGATISDVLAAVLRDGPSWESLPSETPPSVRTLLRRCLQKDPQLRLRHAGDARLELTDPDGRPAESYAAPATRPSTRFLLVAVALTAVIGGAAFYAGTRASSTNLPVRKWVIPQESGDGDDVWMRENMPALSPDGKRVAYADGTRLLIRDLGSLESRVVSTTGLLGLPTWSPDGEHVAFFSDHKELWRASASDGQATKVCDLPAGLVFGLVWRRDQSILINIVYGPRGGQVFSVAESGGRPEPYPLQGAPVPAEGQPPIAFYLRGLPDGGLVYATVREGQLVSLLERDGQTRDLRVAPNNGLTYSDTGHLLYTLRDGTPGVFAVAFDLASGEVSGEPFRVAETGTAPSTASDGTLAYGLPRPGQRQLFWVDRDGTVRGSIGQPQDSMWAPALSPDGARVAVAGTEQGRPNIWTHEIARGAKSRVTYGDVAVDPVWHPTDGRIAFQTGGWDVAEVSVDGGEPKVLAGAPQPEYQPLWSRDGRYFVFVRFGQETTGDIWLIEPTSTGPKPIVQSRFDEMMPSLSPDAKYIAYVSDETGRREVFVRDFPSGQHKRQVSFAGGMWPRWSPKGHEIFYIEQHTLMAVPVRLTPAFVAQAPARLFDVEERSISFPLFDTADGQRFVVVRTQRPPRNGVAVVQNWAAEFRSPAAR
jgi:serine/threonine protein kinase/Tol biopolymer transport system component